MTYVEGGPPETDAAWRRVADTLRQLHRLTLGWPQRTGGADHLSGRYLGSRPDSFDTPRHDRHRTPVTGRSTPRPIAAHTRGHHAEGWTVDVQDSPSIIANCDALVSAGTSEPENVQLSDQPAITVHIM